MADDWYSTVYDNKHSAIDDFIQRKRDMGRSDRTLNTYSRTLREFFHDEFPDLTPSEVEVRHIEEYVSTLTARDLSQNSKRRYLESLSAFYSWAMKRPRFDDINGNPAGVVLEEIPKVIRDRPDCATWKNGKQIVHAVTDPRKKAVCVLLAKTGARISEVLELKMDDIMLDDGYIRF
jgi:integrase/recombinase XerD